MAFTCGTVSSSCALLQPIVSTGAAMRERISLIALYASDHRAGVGWGVFNAWTMGFCFFGDTLPSFFVRSAVLRFELTPLVGGAEFTEFTGRSEVSSLASTLTVARRSPWVSWTTASLSVLILLDRRNGARLFSINCCT